MRITDMRLARMLLVAPLVILGLFALHVHLNRGGLVREAKRLGGGPEARRELIVGFLPVT